MKSFNKSYLSHAVAAAVASTLPGFAFAQDEDCLLYTSPSPRDYAASRMPSSA